ncbi:hypothetical protein C8J56DRAFT_1167656 [Mycena floridula]|nr:hypothetical protein C8J56DRAFT_1167656 [Mycena floridula]
MRFGQIYHLQAPRRILPRKIAFISGHLDPTPSYFSDFYTPALNKAIAEGHHFVCGPSTGVDTLALSHLLSSGVSASDITIFMHRGEELAMRPKFAQFERQGGRLRVSGRNHTERDESLTRHSHYDILRYRTDVEALAFYGSKYRPRISGTHKNELRRKTGIGLEWVEDEVNSIQKTEATAMEKKLKVLNKKIREAKTLKSRLEAGESLELTQLAKARRLDEWIQERKEAADL